MLRIHRMYVIGGVIFIYRSLIVIWFHRLPSSSYEPLLRRSIPRFATSPSPSSLLENLHLSQLADLIEFEERLDNSLQRDLVKVEHVRMRLAHEGLSQDLVDMELIELKFIFDRSE